MAGHQWFNGLDLLASCKSLSGLLTLRLVRHVMPPVLDLLLLARMLAAKRGPLAMSARDAAKPIISARFGQSHA